MDEPDAEAVDADTSDAVGTGVDGSDLNEFPAGDAHPDDVGDALPDVGAVTGGEKYDQWPDPDANVVEEPDDEPIDPTWDDIEKPIPVDRRGRDDLPPVEPGWDATRARLGAWAKRIYSQPASAWITLVVVAGACAFIAWSLHPKLLLLNTTPTGGDMGAHVWGPNYLMRHVLPHGRISGWTPDWYAGFPAFQYYMVVPALAIIGIHLGAPGLLVVPAILAALAIAVSGFVVRALFPARKFLAVIGLILVVLSIPVPYNVAFKLITVVGLITMPLSAWAFAKLADLRFPSPAVFALTALVFVYNREPLVRYPSTGELIGTGNIIGGNMLSTMAGEYSFSIALSLSLVYFGVLVRGLRTGRHRALAAGLLALVGLCHLLPFFFVLLATGVFFVVRPSVGRVKWVVVMGAVAAALAAIWMLPFYWYRTFTIDMGFEQLPPDGLGYIDYLFPSRIVWIFLLAGIGAIVAIAYRNRIGQALLGCVLATALAFRFMPQIQLWNARILPFYYLSVMLLAGFGATGVIFATATLASTRRGHPNAWVSGGMTIVVALAAFAFVGFPLRMLPKQHTSAVDGKSHWLLWSTTDQNPGPGWAEWNYGGIEARTKPTARSSNPYAEFSALVATMAKLGNDPSHGCGRAMWETDNDREGDYGTPMALMLLPYWTDSCIGSMEGLYFESSGTTPFHFINSSELSQSPSNPVRGLPYPGLNINNGVKHLQLLGVKYYLADSAAAISAADTNGDLTKVATSGPWHVYQVQDSPLVAPLSHEPAVWNVKDQAKSSVQPSVAWYLDPTRWDVPFASDGPASWKRVEVDVGYWNHDWSTLTNIVSQATGKTAPIPLPRVTTPAVPQAKVTNIKTTTNSISFDVDQIGTPIQVKTSYYPNWQASGAKGPYRITPNQMVVIPTSKHVELHYGYTPVDYTGRFLLLLGIIALLVLSRRPAVDVSSKMWRHMETARADRRNRRTPAQTLSATLEHPAADTYEHGSIDGAPPGPVADDGNDMDRPGAHSSPPHEPSRDDPESARQPHSTPGADVDDVGHAPDRDEGER